MKYLNNNNNNSDKLLYLVASCFLAIVADGIRNESSELNVKIGYFFLFAVPFDSRRQAHATRLVRSRLRLATNRHRLVTVHQHTNKRSISDPKSRDIWTMC